MSDDNAAAAHQTDASSKVVIPNQHEPAKPLISINLGNVIKLHSSNYISWKLQLLSILTGYNLEGYVDGTSICPIETITVNDVASPNPAYQSWMRQDKLLFGALIGTLTTTVIPLITRATTTKEAWDTLASVYAKPSRGHVKQIKSQLRNISKGSQSISEYMHSVKN